MPVDYNAVDEGPELHALALRFQFVRMKVRFPCKMELEYGGCPFTNEVTSDEDGVFTFNQQSALKVGLAQQDLEVQVSLWTEKGRKYSAGTISISLESLDQDEGLLVPISKCLDAQAVCRVQVDLISDPTTPKEEPIGSNGQRLSALKCRSSLKLQNIDDDVTPQEISTPINNLNYSRNDLLRQTFGMGTKSQHDLIRPKQSLRDFRSRQNHMLNHQMSKVHSRQSHGLVNRQLCSDLSWEFGAKKPCLNRTDQLLESDAYKQNHAKLKHKYKRELEVAKQERSKRVELEAKEGQYKLEILQLKLYAQENRCELQKAESKALELEAKLAEREAESIQYAETQEELLKREDSILELEQSLSSVTEQYHKMNLDRQEWESEEVKSLSRQLSKAKSECFDLKRSHSEAVMANQQKEEHCSKLQSVIENHENELKAIRQSLQQSKGLIHQYEISLIKQKKASEDAILNLEQAVSNLQSVNAQLKRKNKILQEQQQTQMSQHSGIETYVSQAQIDQQPLNPAPTHTCTSFQSQLLRQIQDNQGRLQRLEGEKHQIQRTSRANLQAKDQVLSKLIREGRQQDEKIKAQQAEIADLKSNLATSSGELSKVRQSYDSQRREFERLAFREHQHRMRIKSQEDELMKKQSELQAMQSGNLSDRATVMEVSFLRDQLAAKKKQLEEQVGMNISQSETIYQYVHRLETANAELKGRSESHQIEMEKMQERIKQMSSELSNESNQNILLRTELEHSTQRQKQNIQTILKLQSQKNRAAEDKQAILVSLKRVQMKLKETEEQLGKVEREKNRIVTENRSLVHSNQTQEGIVATISAELSNSQIETLRLVQKVKELKESLGQSGTNLAEKQDRLRAKCEDIANLQMQVVDLQSRNASLQQEFWEFRRQLQRTLDEVFENIGNKAERDNTGESARWLTQDVPNGGELLEKLASQSSRLKRDFASLQTTNGLLTSQILKLKSEHCLYMEHSQSKVSELSTQVDIVMGQKQEYKRKVDQLSRHLEQAKDTLVDKQQSIEQITLRAQEWQLRMNSAQMQQQASLSHFLTQQNKYLARIKELEIHTQTLKEHSLQIEDEMQRIQSSLRAKDNELHLWASKFDIRQKQCSEAATELKYQLSVNEQLRNSKKQLQEQLSKLQLKLDASAETNSSCQQDLLKQSQKTAELKSLMEDLMKHKQAAIIDDIQKGQRIMELEISNSELLREKEAAEQIIQGLQSALQQSKDSIKKFRAEVKDLKRISGQDQDRMQQTLVQAALKENSFKDLSSELDTLSRILKETELKTKTMSESMSRQMLEMQQKYQAQIQGLNQVLNRTGVDLEQQQSCRKNLESENEELHEDLFVCQQEVEAKKGEALFMESEIRELQQRLSSCISLTEQVKDELLDKEEQLYKVVSRGFTAEESFKRKEHEFKHALAAIEGQQQSKWEMLNSKAEEDLSIANQARHLLSPTVEQLEQENKGLANRVEKLEAEGSQLEGRLQSQIRQVEGKRRAILAAKSSQIQQISQQNKQHLKQQDRKETDHKRTQNEFQSCTSTIAKLEALKKQQETSINDLKAMFEQELESQREKDLHHWLSKEGAGRLEGHFEKQLKKAMQESLKSIVSSENQETLQAILTAYKALVMQSVQVLSKAIRDMH